MRTRSSRFYLTCREQGITCTRGKGKQNPLKKHRWPSQDWSSELRIGPCPKAPLPPTPSFLCWEAVTRYDLLSFPGQQAFSLAQLSLAEEKRDLTPGTQAYGLSDAKRTHSGWQRLISAHLKEPNKFNLELGTLTEVQDLLLSWGMRGKGAEFKMVHTYYTRHMK